MVTPSGLRSSEPVPHSSASGSAPNKRGKRRHHDRAEAQQRRLHDQFLRRQTLVALGARCAKSIIRIAFFFTMPISSTMPINAITDRS